MNYNVEKIVDDIMSILGEPPLAQSGVVSGEWEGLTLRNAVRGKIIPEACSLIDGCDLSTQIGSDDIKSLPTKIYWGRDGCGWIVLPADFRRLVCLKMSDWHSCVTTVSPEAMAGRQHGRWRGLRGSFERPVCLFGIKNGVRVLEFFSCTGDDAVVAEGWYIPAPTLSPEGLVNIPSGLVRQVIENVAKQMI